MPEPIIITLEGGVIQDIENIPPGQHVIVQDYDTDGVDPQELKSDKNGDLNIVNRWYGPEVIPPSVFDQLVAACRHALSVMSGTELDRSILKAALDVAKELTPVPLIKTLKDACIQALVALAESEQEEGCERTRDMLRNAIKDARELTP